MVILCCRVDLASFIISIIFLEYYFRTLRCVALWSKNALASNEIIVNIIIHGSKRYLEVCLGYIFIFLLVCCSHSNAG